MKFEDMSDEDFEEAQKKLASICLKGLMNEPGSPEETEAREQLHKFQKENND